MLLTAQKNNRFATIFAAAVILTASFDIFLAFDVAGFTVRAAQILAIGLYVPALWNAFEAAACVSGSSVCRNISLAMVCKKYCVRYLAFESGRHRMGVYATVLGSGFRKAAVPDLFDRFRSDGGSGNRSVFVGVFQNWRVFPDTVSRVLVDSARERIHV